ncbi:MAG: multiheme c-type cytochrome [Rubripirellula sp.]
MRQPLLITILAASVVVAIVVWWWSTATNPVELLESQVVSRPIEKQANGYVGASACQECHDSQFDSWHASYHRTMTQVVSPRTAPEVIRSGSVIVDGETYQFECQGDRFMVRLSDPVAGGQTRQRELVMMTGSHHMHMFWYQSDFHRTPAILPIVYLKDQSRWVPRRSVLLQPPDEQQPSELGSWNQTCSRCHSTHPRQRLDPITRAWDTQVADFGIACEACHGPGETHIAIHREQAAAGVSDPLVHPKELSHAAKSDLCGQCHSVHALNFDAVDQETFFADGNPFRPGQTFDDVPFQRIVQASPGHWKSETFRKFATSERKLNGHFWQDGETRVSGAEYTGMIESPCYLRGEMSCMSCHAMHESDSDRQSEWANDQLKVSMRGDQACLQCHSDYEAKAVAHSHHAVGSTGSQCMNCHMPMTVFGLLKTNRSHRVSSPSVNATIQFGRPNACNLCHLDKTLEWTAGHLADWYGQEKPKLTKDERETSAAVLHYVKGDAAQRAIQASVFAWQPARDTSGTAWMRPFVLNGMNDPYEAVRIISERTLAAIGQSPGFDYDFLAARLLRSAHVHSGIEQATVMERAGDSALLLDADGKLDRERFDSLLQRRNARKVELFE